MSLFFKSSAMLIASACLLSCYPAAKCDTFYVPHENCDINFPDEDVYSYDMDLMLEPDSKTLEGHVEFTFFNDSDDTWNELCLRDYPSLFAENFSHGVNTGGNMTEITNIEDSRNGELDYTRDSGDVSVLWLDLDSPLRPGDEMTLTYDFVATIPYSADRFGFAQDIFNVTNFYPILAEYVNGEWSHLGFVDEGECFYSEIANYDVTVEVPEGYVVAATGQEVSVEEDGDSLIYEFEAPFVRDFVFCASEYFEIETRTINDIDINVVYNPQLLDTDDIDEVIELSFEYTENSLNAFGEAFGKYPYSELDVIFSNMSAGSGMEYPNLVLIDNALASIYYRDYLDVVICHEIGHQWFMGIVGSNSAGEPWLDESFASYSEIVYYEYLGGEQEQANHYQFSHETWDLGAPELHDPQNFIDRSYDEFVASGDDDLYVTAVYEIGKATLYQMEECLGREEFHSVIRAYVHRYAFQNATTADFLEVLYTMEGYENDPLNSLVSNMLRTPRP